MSPTPGPYTTTVVMYDHYPTIQVWSPYYTEAVHWRKPKLGHTKAERDQQNADAYLFAASYDLLKAAEELVYQAGEGMPITDESECVIALAAAIAKATTNPLNP